MGDTERYFSHFEEPYMKIKRSNIEIMFTTTEETAAL